MRHRRDHPERPLSAAMIPSEVPTVGGRGTWSGVIGPIIIVSDLVGALDWSRNFGVVIVESPLLGCLSMQKCLPPRLGQMLGGHSHTQMS